MNIFVLDQNPSNIPQYYCKLHVSKMLLETAQLLCGVHEPGTAPYKRTHYNHPCAKWARRTLSNYMWLVDLGLALMREFKIRSGKDHKSGTAIMWCAENVPHSVPQGPLTPFVQCVPDEHKQDDPIMAYRAYYASKLQDFERRGLNIDIRV